MGTITVLPGRVFLRERGCYRLAKNINRFRKLQDFDYVVSFHRFSWKQNQLSQFDVFEHFKIRFLEADIYKVYFKTTSTVRG